VRLRKLTIGLALILLASGVFAAPALAKDPSISSLKQRLQHAKHKRDRAHERVVAAAANLAGARELLAATGGNQSAPVPAATPDPAATGTVVNGLTVPAGMSPELAAALLADGVVTDAEIAGLQARLTVAKRLERRWSLKVRELEKRIRLQRRIAEWNRRGQWKPLIAIASQRYHVSAAGLTRMMMLESTGQRHVSSGPYHGLFQFMYREWAMSWNEWRDHSIYDGWSQIQLAAKCISRGMGPSIWPLTYRMAF
jgi:predicted flap endonuclease-1-like 5' DNA nuclease